MNFKTTLDLKPFEFNITYDDKLLFLGSCFAENISAYFEKFRFQVTKNPFGITYHPLAIHRILEIANLKDYKPLENSTEINGLWSNFDAHSALSRPSKEEHLALLQNAKEDLHQAVKTSNLIFISLGTAWVYEYIKTNKVVANCHKIPQKEFHKKLLDIEHVKSVLAKISEIISNKNPHAKIVFTLSPVRHLKDGFIENQMSKSTLHLAIQNTVNQNKSTYYFPSYELLLDDLRDYRFYASDFVHPNNLALNYIWEKIKVCFFETKTLQTLAQVDKINKRLAHRFFNPEHPDTILFQQKTQEIITDLQSKYPFILF